MRSSGLAALSLLVMGNILIMGHPAARAQAVYAASFSPRQHAGTMADPWPGSAVTSAINSLPESGGTVIVNDGVWLYDSQQRIGRGNFTLQGTSLAANLIFTAGSLAIGTGANVYNVTISTLTIDQSRAALNVPQAIQLWDCNSCEVSDNFFYGHSNDSIAVLITFGGSSGRILRNTFASRQAGGNQLQINPFGLTYAPGNPTSSGFVISSNKFDSVGILLIGTSNLHVTNNYITNQTLGNFPAIFFTGAAGIITSNLLIDYNTIDNTTGDVIQGAAITGVMQDPGLSGVIMNITIDHNTLRGGPIIGANYFDSECLATCSDFSQTYNVQITNNFLESEPAKGGSSIINVSGGADGSVNGAWIDRNTLSNGSGQRNMILQDNHSYNVRIGSNSL